MTNNDDEQRLSFIDHLTNELRAYQDETTWLSTDVVQAMLTRAAAKVVDEAEMEITIHREIMEDMIPITVINMGDVLSSFMLWPDDVSLLRALLLAHDETAPPRVGEPLTMAMKLKDGRVVSVVTEDLL